MSAFTKRQPTTSASVPNAPAVRRSRLRLAFVLAIGLGVLAVVAVLAAPLALWAYNIERAGRLLDAGLAWPTPRTAASLPQARDAGALRQALAYLAEAAGRRPENPQAYRLQAQAYAALGDLAAAADAYEQARALAPANPLIRWEASLVYERMAAVSKAAPRTPLLDQLATGPLDAPGALIKSLFCTDQGAASCYRGRTTYEQPYAANPRGPRLRAAALFLHPPAKASVSLTVPPEQAALRFVIGLDPAAREWQTDGATFRVWVTPAGGQAVQVAELAIDRATALRGWVPGWADLQPWAGQQITLTLEASPGPAGDSTDDWFAWGEPALTSPSAARYFAAQPELRMQQLRKGLQ